MKRILYFPALSLGSWNSTASKDLRTKEGVGVRFFEKGNSFLYHPYILLSVAHNHSKSLVESIGADRKNCIILGDSGGFQLATGAVKYTEDIIEKYFHWLEENCNYALNIDFPPWGYKGEHDSFKEALEISRKHMEYFEKHQTGKTRFLNVVHGDTIDKINQWLDVVENFNFTGGWSIGSVNRNLIGFLTAMIIMDNRGILEKSNTHMNSLLHVLGITTPSLILPLVYLQYKLSQKYDNIRISYDSSSASIILSYLNAYYPDINKIDTNPSAKTLDLIPFKDVPMEKLYDIPLSCGCHTCTAMKTWGGYYEYTKIGEDGKREFPSHFHALLVVHNIEVFIILQRKIEEAVYSYIHSGVDINGYLGNKMVNIFKVIDKVFDAPKEEKLNILYRNSAIFKKLDPINERYSIDSHFE